MGVIKNAVANAAAIVAASAVMLFGFLIVETPFYPALLRSLSGLCAGAAILCFAIAVYLARTTAGGEAERESREGIHFLIAAALLWLASRA